MNTSDPAWLDRDQYPFSPHYAALRAGRVHYVDEGSGEPILFVHGTPTWSFEYRHLIKGLRPLFRCVAPDHLGFGLSWMWPFDDDPDMQKKGRIAGGALGRWLFRDKDARVRVLHALARELNGSRDYYARLWSQAGARHVGQGGLGCSPPTRRAETRPALRRTSNLSKAIIVQESG